MLQVINSGICVLMFRIFIFITGFAAVYYM